ncbi:hypothetical protein FNF27_01652 [Cafeteria roenbergensis]|uniref:Uncharacterized protein n=2 Tax=Cafeteria roenbergensis TaxID=33653 RepID=A0A5A8ELM5_CAFRO|nr:hypothetical protein FNF27_01652 [Cafeteria roenbergensis]
MAAVAVTGAPGAGKDAVVAGLAWLVAQDAGDDLPSLAKPESRSVTPLALLTKYYEAPLELRVLSAADQPWAATEARNGASGAAAAPGVAPADSLRGAEAVVHVANGSARSAESILAEVAALAAALREADCSPELKLLVVTHVDVLDEGVGQWSSTGDAKAAPAAAASAAAAAGAGGLAQRGPESGGASDGLVAALLEATLTHGFEVVAANAAEPAVGSTGRDKSGLARVVEAMGAVMWSTMDTSRGLRSRPPKAAQAPTAAPAAAPAAASAAGGEATGEGEAAATKASSAGSGEGAGAAASTAEPQAAALAGVTSDTVPGQLRPALGDEEGLWDPSRDGPTDEDGGDELAAAEGAGVDFEELGRMMEAARFLKEHGGKLSREERHKQAAELAMKMATLLGIDEDEAEEAMGEVRAEAGEQ